MTQPRGVLGASDIAALFGCHPYESEYSLWARESGLRRHEGDTETTSRQQIGLDLEPAILAAWARDEGVTVRHNTTSLRSEALPGLGATPDGLRLRQDGLVDSTVQIKTVQPWERASYLDGVPKHYWLQVQQEIMLTQASVSTCVTHGWLVCQFGFDDRAATRIEADNKAQLSIQRNAEKFWQRVRGELPPPEADDHDATVTALMRKRREPKTIDLADDRIARAVLDIDERIRTWTVAAGTAKRKLAEAKAEMLLALGDADRGVFPDGSGYAVQTIVRKAHEVKASEYKKLVRFTNKNAENGDSNE